MKIELITEILNCSQVCQEDDCNVCLVKSACIELFSLIRWKFLPAKNETEIKEMYLILKKEMDENENNI